MAKDWIGNFNKKQVAKPERKVKQNAMVGKPLDEVTRTLAKSNISIEKVETYDPVNGPKNLMKFTVAPTRLKANSRVVLFEENGKVKYYALAEKGPENVEELRTRIDEQETNIKEIKGLQSEVDKLRKQLKEVQDENLKAVGSRDKEIAELKTTVNQFSKFSADFESLKKDVVRLSKGRG
jgi:DNA-binding PadR family transcriptional regulator